MRARQGLREIGRGATSTTAAPRGATRARNGPPLRYRAPVADQSPISLPGGTPVRLYDTRTRKVQPLVPRVPGKVGIYACGPTVYQPIHIGNARPFITFNWMGGSCARSATR